MSIFNYEGNLQQRLKIEGDIDYQVATIRACPWDRSGIMKK